MIFTFKEDQQVFLNWTKNVFVNIMQVIINRTKAYTVFVEHKIWKNICMKYYLRLNM